MGALGMTEQEKERISGTGSAGYRPAGCKLNSYSESQFVFPEEKSFPKATVEIFPAVNFYDRILDSKE